MGSREQDAAAAARRLADACGRPLVGVAMRLHVVQVQSPDFDAAEWIDVLESVSERKAHECRDEIERQAAGLGIDNLQARAIWRTVLS